MRRRERRRGTRAARSGDRDLPQDVGRTGVDTASVGAKTCVFETAATVIASGAVPGEPTVPEPKSSRSLPAAITGTTPAAATLRIDLDQRVVRGLGLGAAAGEVDHVHAVATAASNAATISGVFATLPSGVGTLKTR